MELEHGRFAQSGEYIPPRSLTIVSLAEMAMLQYARELTSLDEQPAPPQKSLLVLDTLTRNCDEPQHIVKALDKRCALTERDVSINLEIARRAYGARTDEQATNIALARQDMPLRSQTPRPRMSPAYEAVLEDTADGLTVREIAAKNNTSIHGINQCHAAIMRYYGGAKNLPTAIRRARESGHWPGTETQLEHTIAGIALRGGDPVSLSEVEKQLIEDRSNGMTNKESGAKRTRSEDTQKVTMRRVSEKLKTRSASEAIVKASLQQTLKLDYSEPRSTFTAREVSVACGLVLGLSNTQIGEPLFINDDTVKSHLRSIFPKIGAKSREQAARKLLEQKYFVPSELPRRPQTAPYRIPRLLVEAAAS
jgi:DNA-binding NarL/FixJ family response regulator